MKFTLEIELGNDAMQDGNDVARALHSLADKMALRECEYGDGLYYDGSAVGIKDANGNTVGKWEVIE